MLSTKLKEAAGNSADATLYVDDVFSTWLYTGNGSTQTITNGIDLAGKGGLVWMKGRSGTYGAYSHSLHDTQRGLVYRLSTNNTNAQSNEPSDINSFNSNGFTLGGGALTNDPSTTYASWTFRKAAKFFDVVTYTGTGSARTIAHSLGVAPGMVIVKRTDTAGNWQVYHRSLTSAAYSIQLNLTDAQASAPTVWNSTAPTSSVFSVGTDATVNASGGTYVAYLYAHDTSSTGVIQCGSYIGTGSTTTINLGWEPQYVMIKRAIASGASPWVVMDSMRGLGKSYDNALCPNTATSEAGDVSVSGALQLTATGFQLLNANSAINYNTDTYIYMAIRMPNKPPTTGTQVFSPIATTSATGTKLTTNFVVDNQIFAGRDIAGHNTVDMSRLTGVSTNATESGNNLSTNTTDAEAANNFSLAWDNTGFKICSGFGGGNVIYWNFKRAPGFFDEVCYTGTGVATTQAHNLGVAPELVIWKARNLADNWFVAYDFTNTTNSRMFLDLINVAAVQAYASASVFVSKPTSTSLPLGSYYTTNGSGSNFVAYLFATLAGISKVGSYTGNGGTQNIDCGFAAGARFFLVKATSTTGSWWVWDSARGITAGNDPALQLNSTAAEITTADAVDPYSPGITVNQEATCSINANGVSYIFLAVA